MESEVARARGRPDRSNLEAGALGHVDAKRSSRPLPQAGRARATGFASRVGSFSLEKRQAEDGEDPEAALGPAEKLWR